MDAVVRAVFPACAAQDVELLASLLCSDGIAFFDGGARYGR